MNLAPLRRFLQSDNHAPRIFLLFGLAYLLNLGLQPLFLEEPRRILIAIEMLYNKNLWVPTELGAYYFKKPPFFNWVLILFSKLPGGFSAFNVRLPTVLSTFGIAWIMYALGKTYVSKKFAEISTLLFLSCGAILFYFSTLAEIDLFYSFITFTSFAALFHFYRQEKYYLLFLSVYFLGAIGTLTKGLPSIIFTGWSVFVFLLSEKDWRRLFSGAHFLGMGLYLLIVGGYLLVYAGQAPIAGLLETIWGENSERTVAENSIGETIAHLFSFPLDLLKDLIPGVLLLIFVIRRNFFSLIHSRKLVHFALLLALANILPYWISPGARMRYIYMLFPFFFMILTAFYLDRERLSPKRMKVFRLTITALLTLLVPASLAVPFLPDLSELNYLNWFAPVFALSFAYLAWQAFKKPTFALTALIIGTAAGRILFDIVVLPQRALNSDALEEKRLAEQILEITGQEPLYIWQSERISFTTIVYLDKWRTVPVKLTPAFKDSSAYYFGCREDMQFPYHELLSFEYNEDEFVLFRQ